MKILVPLLLDIATRDPPFGSTYLATTVSLPPALCLISTLSVPSDISIFLPCLKYFLSLNSASFYLILHFIMPTIIPLSFTLRNGIYILTTTLIQLEQPGQSFILPLHLPHQTFSKPVFTMMCYLCAQLVENHLQLSDRIQLLLRRIKFATVQDQTFKTNEQLLLLRRELVATSNTVEYVLFVLAVRCDVCGYV